MPIRIDPRNDARHMAHALSVARRGAGRTSENPNVGCVIVRDDRVVARGWTQPGGRPHAEVMALRAAAQAADGATAYVTLEPCAHTGKTGPCADALIDAGIKRVVMALEDPDARVLGRGRQMLEAAGISVTVGVLADEARFVLRGFLMNREKGRPHVTLKFATSLDGKIALASGEIKWITLPDARRHAQLERARADAILVGTGTVQADNPSLTCRLSGLLERSPQRIILDASASLQVNSALAATAHTCPVLLCHDESANKERLSALHDQGVITIAFPDSRDIASVLQRLGARGINRLLVEGGSGVHGRFLSAARVDEIHHYQAGTLLGGDGIAAIGPLMKGAGLPSLKDAPIFSRVSERRLGADKFTLFTRAE